MDLKKLGEVPKSYVKEILNSLSKLDKLKKVPFFTGIHFKDTEEELNKKIDDYRRVDRESSRIWKIVELSRNEGRPQCQDYIKGISMRIQNDCCFFVLSLERVSLQY